MMQTESLPSPADYRRTAEYQAAHDFLLGRIDYERFAKMPYSRKEMNLDRMAHLLELLGDPQDRVDVIHIAGTKGKGSTAAFLSSALHSHGLRCGSYTSPHLHHIEERFRLNGLACEPETFTRLVQQIRPSVEKLDLRGQDYVTYFEIATALGFLFFLHERVDVAVVEVGLGGRLDSTNVCKPLVSVITSISFDHTKQLGNTLALIATEKAGIIKSGVPVVSGVVAEEPSEVIRKISQQKNARLWERDKDFRYTDYQSGDVTHLGTITFEEFSDSTWHPVLQDVPLGSRGEHQAANASVAWATLQLLPDQLHGKSLRPSNHAVRQGFASSRCDARIEVVAADPLIVIDAAHNPASAQALVQTLAEFPTKGTRWLILATTRGKDVPRMLEILLPHFDRVICTRYENNPRGHNVSALLDMAIETRRNQGCEVELIGRDTPVAAWQFAKESSQPADQISITGSFFIAAELRDVVVASGRQ